MTTRSVAVKFGVFALISLALFALLYNTMVRSTGGPNTPYRADFSDVSGLRAGDDVRVAGVRVGGVTGIDVRGDSARVSFTVDTAHELTSTTGLVLKYRSLVGQKYLALVRGADNGNALPADSVVPRDRTSPGFDLTALLNGFRPLFQVLRPEDVNKLSQSIIQVLQGEGGTISGLLQETTRLTNYVADRDQLFHQVASNLVPVLGEIAGNGTQLSDAVRQLSQLTEGLAANRASIGASIDSMAALLDRVDSTVDQLRAPLTRDIATLQQVLRLYASTKDQYGAAPGQFGNVLELLGRITSYHSATNVYFCTVNIGLPGLVVPTDPPTAKYSKVCK